MKPHQLLKETLRARARTHTLSIEERAEMRDAFTAFLNMHTHTDTTVLRHTSPSVFSSALIRSGALATLCSIVLLYAAEGALPNEPLYAIKTSVTEPILQLSASYSPEASARMDTRIVERRLGEAVELLYTHKLTDDVANELSQTIDEHAAQAHAHLTSDEDAPLPEALTIAQTLEQALDTHADVLHALPETATTGRALAEHVTTTRAHAQHLTEELVQTILSNTTSDVQPEDIAALQQDVHDALATFKEAQEESGALEDPLLEHLHDTHETTYEDAAADLAHTDKLLSEGKGEEAYITLIETYATLQEGEDAVRHLTDLAQE